jgi:N-terminal acetyltransferase B complex non-catalytic subunit
LPGDDLILLATQQLLRKDPSTSDFYVAAVLLEAGIQNSPSNATLKLAALDVYSRLDAAARAWSIYQELQIKHIQLDTCTFLILPVLLSGGFYQEILKVCKGLLMLHTGVVRDTCEYSGRAMENGILSKAEEFMCFQREKMTNSLTAMEATGLILDSAPFFAHDAKDAGLGVAHGIVGGEADFDRATDMVMEVRNPYGALSLLRRAFDATDFKEIADNRDLTTLSYEILYRRTVSSREDIINESVRRGHIHSLLIRSALCVNYTKGPKKGKIVKPSEELLNCCRSLLVGVDSAKQFCSKLNLRGTIELMNAQLELCRLLVIISSGIGLENKAEDTLDEREKHGIKYIQSAKTALIQATKMTSFLDASHDVGFVCCLLPGSVVPFYALFRMCENVLETYGWGKRKQKTKPIAAEFTSLATEFAIFIKGMIATLSR